jgi:hypothetical protein
MTKGKIMSQDITAAILDAEKARCAAMLKNDAGMLDAILDPRLVFAHATGGIDDKPTYLAKMAAGRLDYISIDWDEPVVIALGDGGALLTGRMNTHVRVESEEKRLNNRVTSGWALGTDGAWRMVAFQSTPLKI